MNKVVLLTFTIYLSLHSTLSWAAHEHDIFSLNAKEEKFIKSRLTEINADDVLLTTEQRIFITESGLNALVYTLLTHKHLMFEDSVDVIDFAEKIMSSGYTLSDLEARIIRYTEKGLPIFTALERAIERERFHRWHVDIVNRVTNNHETKFIAEVDRMDLSIFEKERVFNVYATCIASFTNPQDRKMMKPEVCDEIDDYESPRHLKNPVTVRENYSEHETMHLVAYRSLMDAARHVNFHYALSTFERIAMAKCIAEQSLRFFQPSQHRLKALRKHWQLAHNAPEKSFFMRSGVCSNFSGVAYNAALELGLQGKVHLAKKGVHVYLEFEEGGEWFHAHPFNSKSHCDITRFRIHDPTPLMTSTTQYL